MIYFIFQNGWTPLKAAALYGFADIVQYLVDNGANVNIADKVR